MKKMLKKYRIPLLIAIVVVIAAAAVTLFTVIKNRELDQAQTEFMENLQLKAGSYEENNIVLSNTNKYEAEALAEKLGARLRMSFDGRFAVLYLPENTTIADISKDDSNKKYISAMSPDYFVRNAEAEEADEAEEQYIHLSESPVCDDPDPYFDHQTYLDYLNLKNTMNVCRGEGLKVAVIDTGIDTDHPEFAGRISDWSYNATYDKIVRDWGDWSLVEDNDGHGTAVAGVIAAASDGAGISGLCPEVEIIVIKAESSGGQFVASDLVFGLYYAIERDVDVVNMSFALPRFGFFDEPALLAYDSDIICVASAGNDGLPGSTEPASTEYVVGVGALEDDSWELAAYSNYGENVETVAPGVVFTTKLGGTYGYMKGTSFSSPIVASAALMYKQVYGKYITNDKFYERLHASCCDLGDPGPDFYYGYGAIDFNALLWEPTGTVTFNMMTDELDDVEKLIVYNHPIQDIPEPERLYAVFDGWYYDPQFTEELNWYEDSYNTDMTLYAKWANEDDTIPYDYRILEDGTVEILSYKGKRRFITIPDYIEGRQVSSIGDFAFSWCSNLRRVILPHYLKYIGSWAFAGCDKIVSMNIPDEVTYIGYRAFYGDIHLTSVTLGRSVTTIENEAFRNCVLLKSIYFPASVQYVNGTAFEGDVSIESFLCDGANPYFISIDGVLYNKSKTTLVIYPATLTRPYKLRDETVRVGVCAFSNSSITSIDLNKVEYIESTAFENSRLLSVYLPDSCVSIGEESFSDCASMSSLRISRSLTEIPYTAFGGAALDELFIPKNIKVIGPAAFKDAGINVLTFEEGSELYIIYGDYDNGAFSGTLITNVVIPPDVVSIGKETFFNCIYLSDVTLNDTGKLNVLEDKAFYGTSSLRSINIPDSVRVIGKYCFSKSRLTAVYLPASLSSYGEGAFAYCSRLTSIRVDENNEVYADADGVAYTKNYDTVIGYPCGRAAEEYRPLNTTAAVGNCAFEGCEKLYRVIMPDSIKNIYKKAFYSCKKMREYALSEKLEYVDEYAFAKNEMLRYIRIPDSVKQLSRFTFYGDTILETVEISNNSSLRRLGMQVFSCCGITEFRVPSCITSIAQYAFEGCERLRTVTFAAGSQLESMSAYFFNGCDSIQEIIFENGSKMTSLQAHALHGLTNLLRIDFGDAQITNIDNYAFRNCPKLYELNLPDSLVNIGRFAFYRCKSLPSLTLPEGLEHIGEYAFLGTSNFNLYFKSESLPIYLDENWDAGVVGYYTGVTETYDDGVWEYANLKNGTVAILGYKGTEKNIDLSEFAHGTVSIIGGYAFAYTDIESVVLPDSLEQIQRHAFSECAKLKNITIPENVTFIAQYAFYKTGIETLTFTGNNIKVIEQYAFSGTKALKSVTIPGSLEKLGTGVFYQSGIDAVSFEEGFSLDKIPENTFAETNLKSVIIPDCVTTLGHNAFSHNRNLKSVDLGAGEDLMIMSNVFYNTGLTSVYIGKNVRFIGEYSFMDLDDLTAFEIDPDNPYYTAEDGVIYNKNKTKLIAVPSGKTGSFVISKDIEVIGFGAFENSKLSEITIEDGSALVTLGYRAFYGAKNITHFTVPKSVVSIDYYAFAECDKLVTVEFEEGSRISGVYEGAFFGCRSLKNITLPDTVVEISDYAFYACESLDTLPLSENTGVLGIYSNAFAYTGISELDLPEALYDIGDYAFRAIPIKELVIEPEDVRILEIGLGAFADCDRLESVTLPFTGRTMDDPERCWFGFIFGSGYQDYDPEFVPESVKNITITHQKVYNVPNNIGIDRSFYRLEHVETVTLPEDTYFIGPETFIGFKSLKSFDIPYTITDISDAVFYDCYSLKEMYLPDNVERVGVSAFAYCISLKEVHLNEGLKIIDGGDPGAFEACVFEEIDLPDSLERISYYAFCECENLKRIIIPEKVKFDGSAGMFANCSSLEYAYVKCDTVAEEMFSGCKSLKTVTLSDDYTQIGDRAFMYCEKLQNIEISDKLERIGSDAFAECTSLEMPVILPEGLTEIGDAAFYNTDITYLSLPSTLKTIGRSAFEHCKNLALDLVIPEGVERIDDWAFNDTGITSVVIPHSMKYLGDSFAECTSMKKAVIRAELTEIGGFGCLSENSALEEVVMPDTVRVIRNGAFRNCSHMKLSELPSSLLEIGGSAFQGCKSICELVLPEGLIKIADDAFLCCYSLISLVNNSSLDIDFDNEIGSVAQSALIIRDKNGLRLRDGGMCDAYGEGSFYEFTEDGYFYRNASGEKKLLAYFGDEEEITLSDSQAVVSLEYSSATLKSVIIEEGTSYANVSSPGVDKLTVLTTTGGFDFNRYSLKELVIAEGNPYYEIVDGVLYGETDAVWIEPGFEGEVYIREGTVSIGWNAFEGRDFEYVHFPESLEIIGDYAFKSCRKLKEVILPPNVTLVSREAFMFCDSLEKVDLCNCETVGMNAFAVCKSLRELHLGGCSDFGYYAFSECPLDTIYFDNCTKISGSVFSLCRIDSLVIPGTVKIIEDDAFSNNSELTEVIIKSGVETIGADAFRGCGSLSDVIIENGVQTIGAGAFAFCSGLKTLHIPASVREIGLNALGSIENVTLDENNEYFELIGGYLKYKNGGLVWSNDGPAHIIIPQSFTEIPAQTFKNRTDIVSVVIPEGVTRICRSAFEGCENLKYVTLPSTLEVIEYSAFAGTAIEEITIPASVTDVYEGVFDGCINLKTINIEEGNSVLFVLDGVLYKSDTTVFGTQSVPEKIVIPDGIVGIDSGAFKNSPAKEIEFPDTLTYIGANAFGGSGIKSLILPDSIEYLDPRALNGCNELESVYIPASVTYIYFGELEYNRSLKYITVAEDNPQYYAYDNIIYEKGTNYFVFVPQIISGAVTIPEGVTLLPAGVLSRTGITGVNLPDTLTAIMSGAFDGSNIIMLHIPPSVTYVAEDAFDGCEKLIYVENESDAFVAAPFSDMLPYARVTANKGELSSGSLYTFTEGRAEGWYYNVIDDFMYGIYDMPDEYNDIEYKCRVFAYVGNENTVTIPTQLDGVDVIPYHFWSAAETVIIPEGMRILPDEAFYENPNVKHIILPESLYEIGGAAFYRCYSLAELDIPHDVLSLGWEMCFECEKLKRVSIPEGIVEIPNRAFGRCYSLSEVDLPSTIMYIGDWAFIDTDLSGTLELPPNVKRVGNSAFYWTNITKIIVPYSIEELQSGSFMLDTLAEIVLPDKAFIIRPNAFFYGSLGYYYGAFAENENNWDGDFLYCGSHLLAYRGNDVYVKVERDVSSIAEDAFSDCSRMRFLEISGSAHGALVPKYTPSLEMLIIRNEPKEQVNCYFKNEWDSIDVPSSLKTVVIKSTCYIEYWDDFGGINDISIYVENTKADAPFDRIAPGWNNGNLVTYGDKWYLASFFDEKGEMITMECFRNSQAIRPPYVVLPKSGDTAYTHIGWDTDGDGEPDGLPASRLSDVTAYAVVETSKPAYYTVKFVDKDRKTVISEAVYEFGAAITAPTELPENRGYTFIGWENFSEGDTVSENIRIYSLWQHDGDGHVYEQTVIPPACTDRGYTLHKCSICGDEYRTDYVKENWHTFGEWSDDVQPTCTENGWKHRSCIICGFEENAIIETTGHDYVSTVIKAATCTERGVLEHICSVCGNKEQETIPLESHDYIEVYAEKEYIKWLDEQFFGIVWGCNNEKTEFWYYTCSRCGKIQTNKDVAIASAAGSSHRHEFCAILNESGKAVAVRCSLCGEVQCHEHVYELTSDQYGEITYTCANCGDIMTAQRTYTVKFINYDDTVISEAEYHYGDNVTVPSAPAKPNDNTYTYSFAGWDKEVTAVSDDITYTATYTPVYINYTIKFVDYDNTVLSEKTYHYNDTVIAPDNPTREIDGQYTYTFAGWDKDITLCKGDTTYKAKYTSEENVYTITFKNYDGAVIAVQALHYNETVIPPADPERASDNIYTYSFTGWDKEIVNVTEDAEYTATYKEAFIEYTVKFVDHDDTVLSEKTYHYKDSVTVPNDPVRYDDNEYTYTFNGWDKEITVVTGDTTYRAVYDRTEKPPFIPGDINGDGEVDNKDVVALFRYVSGVNVEVNVIALDVNGDGKINNKDITILFRYLNNHEIKLSDKPYIQSQSTSVTALIPMRSKTK